MHIHHCIKFSTDASGRKSRSFPLSWELLQFLISWIIWICGVFFWACHGRRESKSMRCRKVMKRKLGLPGVALNMDPRVLLESDFISQLICGEILKNNQLILISLTKLDFMNMYGGKERRSPFQIMPSMLISFFICQTRKGKGWWSWAESSLFATEGSWEMQLPSSLAWLPAMGLKSQEIYYAFQHPACRIKREEGLPIYTW